ncbi:hypothetical protein NT01EI_2252 [Edwardsiella ictaluri 93-146]|uniref:Uncharacterized protein n=1 Tax=Edwardsiella ictaluri (strain 93-146) TaxID=634503 RepID=C5BGZ5_EDWI9|nr:hypothetical protein NT01EI_2252 [Edwardsiella ictaluri 93-146]
MSVVLPTPPLLLKTDIIFIHHLIISMIIFIYKTILTIIIYNGNYQNINIEVIKAKL